MFPRFLNRLNMAPSQPVAGTTDSLQMVSLVRMTVGTAAFRMNHEKFNFCNYIRFYIPFIQNNSSENYFVPLHFGSLDDDSLAVNIG
jgi:hypothetical protein